MIQVKRPDADEIAERLNDFEQIEAVLKLAARDAVRAHARAGVAMVVWKDGKIVLEGETAEAGSPVAK